MGAFFRSAAVLTNIPAVQNFRPKTGGLRAAVESVLHLPGSIVRSNDFIGTWHAKLATNVLSGHYLQIPVAFNLLYFSLL